MTSLRLLALAVLVLCGLGLPGCSDDVNPPTVRFVAPRHGDTLAAGTVQMRVVAADDRGVWRASFWARGEMVGFTWRHTGDTFSIGWDCTADTFRDYTLSVFAEDRAENRTLDEIIVHVRR